MIKLEDIFNIDDATVPDDIYDYLDIINDCGQSTVMHTLQGCNVSDRTKVFCEHLGFGVEDLPQAFTLGITDSDLSLNVVELNDRTIIHASAVGYAKGIVLLNNGDLITFFEDLYDNKLNISHFKSDGTITENEYTFVISSSEERKLEFSHRTIFNYTLINQLKAYNPDIFAQQWSKAESQLSMLEQDAFPEMSHLDVRDLQKWRDALFTPPES